MAPFTFSTTCTFTNIIETEWSSVLYQYWGDLGMSRVISTEVIVDCPDHLRMLECCLGRWLTGSVGTPVKNKDGWRGM